MRMKVPKLFTDAMSGRSKWQRDISAWQRDMASWMQDAPAPVAPAPLKKPRKKPGRLKQTNAFGNNPGDLTMLHYTPPKLAVGAALVVVLHGCDQAAGDFDAASGWSDLANRDGFALLYPEQKAGNNPNRCFNWFRPSAASRDRGEVMSVRCMIDYMLENHALSNKRIHIFGLSAGGAMAAALLASYPDMFAGGAIVAGLPFGAARDAMGAMSAMNSGASKGPVEWGDLARAASDKKTGFPPLSIWHGVSDRVVSVANADGLADQWLDLHDLDRSGASELKVGRQTIRHWSNAKGEVAVEQRLIDDMDHGLPVSARNLLQAPDKRFFYDVGVDAATEMAKRWQLAAK